MLDSAMRVAKCDRHVSTLRVVGGVQVCEGQLALNASKDVKLRCKQV